MSDSLQPVNNLKEVMKNWQRIKDEIQDTECCGETWDFLSEWVNPETGTAQHALWTGCEKIVELCHKINDQINMAYPHPIPRFTDQEHDDAIRATKLRIRQLFLDDSKCELCEKVDEADGYDGQNEGCEKGLCIECAIDKALREFGEKITTDATTRGRTSVLDELDTIAKKGMREKEDSLGKRYCMEHPKQVDSCWHGLHRIVESLRRGCKK